MVSLTAEPTPALPIGSEVMIDVVAGAIDMAMPAARMTRHAASRVRRVAAQERRQGQAQGDDGEAGGDHPPGAEPVDHLGAEGGHDHDREGGGEGRTPAPRAE